jgi:hypothetical protein
MGEHGNMIFTLLCSPITQRRGLFGVILNRVFF